MTGLELRPNSWWAWQHLGTGGPLPPWGASPMYVTAITPLKSGGGFLNLAAVMLLRPFTPRKVRARLKVVLRRPEALIALWEAPGEINALIAIAPINVEWMQQHCAWLSSVEIAACLDDQCDLDPPTYLSAIFGETSNAMMLGSSAVKRKWLQSRAAPRATGIVPMDLRLDGGDAYLLLRGTTPKMQEDKWFVFREGNAVVFARSWTGIRIWSATITVATDAVTVSSLIVNRDRRQYAYGTPDEEVAKFKSCLRLVLFCQVDECEWPEALTPRAAAAAWRGL